MECPIKKMKQRNHYHAGFCPLFKPIRQKQPKPLPFYKTSEMQFSLRRSRPFFCVVFFRPSGLFIKPAVPYRRRDMNQGYNITSCTANKGILSAPSGRLPAISMFAALPHKLQFPSTIHKSVIPQKIFPQHRIAPARGHTLFVIFLPRLVLSVK